MILYFPPPFPPSVGMKPWTETLTLNSLPPNYIEKVVSWRHGMHAI